jgi:hypothetical protein
MALSLLLALRIAQPGLFMLLSLSILVFDRLLMARNFTVLLTTLFALLEEFRSMFPSGVWVLRG